MPMPPHTDDHGRQKAALKKGLLPALLILMLAALPVRAYAILDGFCINASGSASIGGTGIRAVAVQPWDGKVVIGGEFTITGGDPQVTLKNLARLNTDGTLDTGFAPEPDGPVSAIVIKPDRGDPMQPGESRIYIGGSFGAVGLQPRHGLARLKSADASVDAFNPATMAGTAINAMILQADQSIVVGGAFSEMAGQPRNNVARISVATASDGVLAAGFAAGTDAEVHAIVQQDGMIVIGGDFSAPRPFLARFDAGDLLDGSFSAEPGAAVRALALQPDGKIVLGGDFTSITTSADPLAQARRYLARLTNDGRLDDFDPFLEEFDSSGYVASVSVQPDGKILVGGRFTRTGPDPDHPNHHVARFKPDATLDASLNPDPDGFVDAIALEPDGKFLLAGKFASAGGKARTRLARFYFHGALDDDAVPLDPSLSGEVMTLSLQPDGSTTIGGWIPAAAPGIGTRVAKLNSDLSLNNAFGPTLDLTNQVTLQALQPDGKVLAAGWFRLPKKFVIRLDAEGNPDPTFASYFDTLPELSPMSRAQAMAPLPKRSRMSKDSWSGGVLWPRNTLLEEGMIYIGGIFEPVDAAQQKLYLLRVHSDGTLDTSFNPPPLDGVVYSIVIQPDDKILIGGDFTGRIMRLETNGDKDETFNALVPDDAVNAIGLQKDGQILVVGSFTALEAAVQPGESVPRHNIVRLNNMQHRMDDGSIAEDGSIDPSFQVEPTDNYLGSSALYGFALQANGSLLMYGFFDQISDGSITKNLDCIARVDTDGRLDDLSLLSFNPDDRWTGLIENVTLQPDGKILAAGGFANSIERPANDNLTRFSNDWTTEDLSVNAVGSAITWLRSGTGPELWGVYFEETPTPDEPDSWTYLGRGSPITGGWRLAEQALPHAQNRYVRARGYTVGSGANSSASLVESVRLYYLKEVITVKAATEVRRYGDENSATYTAQYLDANGQPKTLDPASFFGAAIFTAQADSTSSVGNYPITADVANLASPIYAFVPADGILTVSKRPASVTPAGGNKTYGSALPEALTGSLSGFMAFDGVTATYSRTPGDTVAASPYLVSATLSPAGVLGNYDITYNTAAFTVTKKGASVTPDAGTKVYGTPGPDVLTGTLSGFLASDGVTAIYSRTAGESVAGSPYSISATLGPASVLDNYDITYSSAAFTITKKAVFVTPTAGGKIYGTPGPDVLTGTLSGFLASDGVTATYNRTAGESVVGSPYSISATLSPAGVLANYDITYSSAAFTITKKAASVTPTAGGKIYGTPGPDALTGTLSGFLASDGVTATYSRTAGESVAGSPYSISVTLSPAVVLQNYDITYSTAAFSITKKSASVTPIAGGKVYGTPGPDVLTGTLSGFLASDGVIASYSRTAGESVVGSPYSISATLSPAGVLANYDITYSSAAFTITKKAASVTPTAGGKIYGTPGPDALTGTLSGFLASDGVTATYSRTAGESVAGSPYSISAALSPAGVLANYDITYNTAAFTITKKGASVTPTACSKVYGTPGPDVLTGTLSGFLASDSVTATYSRTAGESVAGSPYSISATLNPAGVLANYDITYSTAAFTITKKSASVTPTAGGKVYGTPGPDVLTGTLSGFLASDGVTATYSRTAGESVAGSPYSISATLSPAGVLANYDITYSSAAFTIAKKAASVTPTAGGKIYGTPGPDVLTGTLSGFLASDGVTASYSRTAGESVVGSPYSISATLSPAGVLANYDITYSSAAFTITKKAASVTPTAGGKIYGTPGPDALTGTLTGFLASDGVTATYNRTAGESVAGSPYLISATLSPAGVLANYDITYSSAAFTITKKPASVTPTAGGKVYGTPGPDVLTGTLSGFLASDGVTASYSRVAGESVAGSPYLISATLSPAGVLANYDITYSSAAFTITKKPASVTPTAGGKVYGTPGPDVLTGTLSGFLASDGVTATYNRTAGESVAGSPYSISATLTPAVVLQNYDIMYSTAAFTITKKSASLTPIAGSKVYGTPGPDVLTGTLTGFLASDSVTATYNRTAGESVAGSPYSISATLSPAGVLANYDITYSTAAFTITKKPALVTPTAGGKVYGTPDPDVLTGTLSGFLASDGVTASYSRTAGESVAGSPHLISATLSPAGVLANYDITYSTAAFTITKKPASVMPTAGGKVYGTPGPDVLTGTLSGFLASDGVTATYSRTTGENVDGSPYSISATLSPAGVLGNYDITYSTAVFAVTKKAASVTPTAGGKVYGTPDPDVLTGTLSGFLASDGVTATYSRTAGENVVGSPYSISATLSPAGVLANYDITYNTAAFSITKKAASVTPIAGSKVYGTPGPDVLTGTLTGFLASDGVTATYSRTAGENVAGSPYSISATLSPAGVLANYDITYSTAAFTIAKKPASVTPTVGGKVYGTPGPDVLTGTLSGFLASDGVTATYSRTAGESVAGSPYPISATLNPAGVLANYDITYNTAVFSITKKAASVTPIAGSKVYGTPSPDVLTGTLTGFLASDGVTATYSRTAGENVAGSPYSISATLSPAGVLANYDITYSTAAFTITQKPASVTPTAGGKVYGTPGPDVLTGTLTGFLASDGVTATYNRTAGENVAGSPYLISATLSPVGGLGNYDITYNTAAFTITKKAASVTPTAGGKVYGTPGPDVLTGTLSGFLASDSVTATYNRTAGESVVGSPYSISATLSPAGVLANYDITYSSSAFTIAKKPASVTPTAVGKVYGTPGPDVLTGTLSGFLSSDGVTANYSRTTGENVDGSPYSISATLSPAGVLANYDITYSTAAFTITKKPASVTPTAGGKVYGTPGPDVLTGTLTGFLASDGVTATYSRAAGESVAGSPYSISATLSPAGVLANYDITYSSAAFTITKKPASVTPIAASKTYGTPGPDVLTGTLSGFLSSDGVTANYSRTAGESVAGSPYPISATLSPAGVLANYDISYNTAAFTVTKKGASVTPIAGSKVYGMPGPEILTGTLNGFLASDGVTATYNRTAGETVAGGPYIIRSTLAPAEVLANYDVTYNTAEFTIDRKAVSVTAVASGKTYGGGDPALVTEYNGFLPWDMGAGKITFSSTRAAGENATTYAITPAATDSDTGLLANYTVSYVPGTFTIAKAPLAISAENKTRLFGAPNPAFTATFTGLAGLDTADSLGGVPSLTTVADAASPAGNYPIVAGLGSITSDNYSYSFVDGVLTVAGGASQNITFNPMRPKTFGDGDFDPGATASSQLPVEYASSAPGIAAAVGRKLRVAAPGTSEITASQAGNQEYEPAADVVRTLTVNPPPWNGLGFDGSNDVMRTADGPQLNFGTKSGFSIEAWLHLDGSQADGTGLLSKGEGGETWPGYQLILHQDRIAAEIGDGTVTFGVPDGLIGTSSLNDGQWHHVALSVDRASAMASLYLDGRLEARLSNPALGLNPDNAENLQLGVDRSGSRFFRGEIDEVRLWDTARSKDEIRAAVSQIIDPLDEPHLVAYYHFDEGDAGLDNAAFTTAPERTANAAHGALQGFALSGADSNWIRSGAFLPLLETAPITSITSNAATGGGLVYANYYPATDVGLCWGPAPDPGLADTCSHSGSGPDAQAPDAGRGGPFVGTMTGLTPGATYHVRGFAANQMGTAYGNDVTFQAARLDQTINFGPIAERTYGDAGLDLAGSASSGLSVSYTSSNPAVATVENGGIRIMGAGSTVITASQGGNETYNPAQDVSRPFVVDKKALTVTADTKSRAYRTPNPTLTASYQGFIEGEDLSVISGAPDLSTAASQESVVGSYAIVVGLGTLAAQNYSFVFTNSILSVRPAAQTISFEPVADRTYGDAGFAPGGSASSGLTISYTSSNPDVAIVVNGGVRIMGAGSTVVTASQPGNECYEPALDVSQTFTVNKKALTVTADNKSRVYLAPNPTLTASYQGFVDGEGAAVISGAPEISTAALQESPVGNYVIIVAPGNLAALNYRFALNNGILTVRPASQTISFGPVATRTYGDAGLDPGGSSTSGLPITYTSSNPAVAILVNGAIRIVGAGSTVITASQAGNECYTPALDVSQPFTVNKKVLTVTADDKRRAYNTANPALTASYQGFVEGEDIAVISGVPDISTAATQASPVGSYDIVVGLGNLAAQNYSFVLANGILSVGPASQTITFEPMRPKTFGDGDFDPGATASSQLPVAYASSTSAAAAVVGRKIRVSAPGTTEITASQTGNEDYQPALDVVRTLTVNPPPWNGLGFDGSNDVMRTADGPQLNFGTKSGFSIEAWLHLDGSQADGTGLLSKGEGGETWPGYQLILHQDRIAAEIGDGTVTFGVPDGLIGTSSLNDGQWHHVALSVDRASAMASLYLDGRLEARLSNPALGLNPDNAENLQLGVDRSGSRFFRGEIDEVRLWDTARSKDEIRAAVSQIIDPLDEPHLVAYYHFDEGDAGLDNAAFTTAPERTANAAHGALQGFALSGADSNWIRSGAFLPLLETAPITSITSNAATGGGLVYANYYPATDVGLCWGPAPDPGLADTCSHSGSGPDAQAPDAGRGGPFVGTMTGLTPGATYHVRGFAANQMGTAYGNDVTFQAARLDQTINFGPIAERTYGDAGLDLAGSASSGLSVSYTSSNPAVATVENGGIRIMGAGSTVITASQGGNETYNPAQDVSRPFVVDKKALTVTADTKSRAYRTPNPTLTASYQGFIAGEDISAIAGAPELSTAAWQESPVGSYDIVVGLGTLAAQNYRFVPVTGTLIVFQSCQEITFPPIGDRTYGDAPFGITASACSGLGISFTSSNPQVATISGNVVTITGAGSVVITARQEGSDDLEKAPDVSQTLIVHKRGQWLSFSSLTQKVLGDAPFGLTASASSGLPVSYLSSEPGVAVISGSTVTVVGAGTTVITAIQEGNGNYNAALAASQPLTVALEGSPPLLALSTLPSGAVTADPVLNVTGSASDASGIASLTVNGADLTGEAELFSSAVPLGIGDNSISVAAKDGAGNITRQILSIILDATAPAIGLVEPADNSVTDVPFFTAKGTVAPGSAVTLGVNGGAPQSLSVDEGSFTGSGYLQQGVNAIEFTAVLSGRSSSTKRSVTLAPGKPFVAITEPAEDVRTEADSITIRGIAGLPGTAVSVILDVDGKIFTPALEEGAFRQQIALDHARQVHVSATAADSTGNLSTARRNIIRVVKITGDMDLDGVVDIRDAMALLRISLDKDLATPQALDHGDVAPLINGACQPDGKIDVGDVLVLLRKIVGLVDY